MSNPRVNQEDASTGRIREGDNRKDSKHNQHSRNSRPAQFARRRLASAEGGVDNQEEIQESQGRGVERRMRGRVMEPAQDFEMEGDRI